ncbi:carbohydrate sulfotransferase 9-like [Homarus americanus]|uniref:Carbohydrate sulfotransferase n=1 Tax=Homarus americanus TaxID=6706 RepID=A0A8J5JDN5_HOMAM|nr:carbohydrate sulfotransferase 9-like [Homarus americanus]XP_042203737.1 carbohydrate sulfotransferase 9-like [Homarus americanus]XP_042203738.1 carbohydrate sulfotransferase 9-like [Homarus americanus]KAG7156512.1 Carbohydrate sulfotransferase 10-like 2 [Homarus americanus]
MNPRNNWTVRVVALTTLAGAFLVYHHSKGGATPLDTTTTQVLINDNGRAASVRLSLSEIQSLILKATPKSTERETGVHDKGRVFGQKSQNNTRDKVTKERFLEVEEPAWTHPVIQPSRGSFLNTLDLSTYPDKDREFLQNHLKKMINREKHVMKMCQSRTRLIVPRPIHLLWHNHHPDIVLCPVYKASPTPQMMELLNQLQVTVIDPAERTRIFTSGLRIIVVRDPLIRILHIYLDKIATDKPCSDYIRKVKNTIKRKYRRGKNTKSTPRFEDFVQYILDSTRNLHQAQDWVNKVQYWKPYWVDCNVCGANYDLFLKTETLKDDEKFLTTVVNLKEYQNLVSTKHLEAEGEVNFNLSQQEMEAYLKQLDRKQMQQLYQHYLLDSELFQYNSTKYLHLTHD